MQADDAPRTLLEEMAWLERLAHSLVSDPHEARDLAQSTWVAFLGSEHKVQGSRRAWMVSTLRRLRAYGLRSTKRRQAREEWVARREDLPSVQEVTARAEQHERLLCLVRGLSELYRVPILLRYVDGLEPRLIAEQLGIKVRTVHTRLNRGLALLRERLDADHPSGREGWVSALIVGWQRKAVPAPNGWWKSHAVQLAGLTVCAASVTWVLVTRTGRPPSTGLEGPGHGARPEQAQSKPLPRTAQRDSIAVPVALEPPAVEGEVVKGLVLDWEGQPLAGAHVEFREQSGIAVGALAGEPVRLLEGPPVVLDRPTDQDGRFEGRARASSWIRAEAPGYVVALAAGWNRWDPQAELRVVLAPADTERRRVQSLDGEPVAGALVRVTLDDRIDQRFPFSFARVHPLHWEQRSDSTGLLGGPEFPLVPEARILVRAHGFETLQFTGETLPPGTIRMRPLDHPMQGVVLGPNGEPRTQAYVSMGDRWAQTDDDGVFLLQGTKEAGSELLAAAPGFALKRVPLDSSDAHPVVHLDQLATTLQGRFVDRNGRGIGGIEVALVRPNVASGPEGPLVLESVAAGQPSLYHRSTSDESGFFELGGLGHAARQLRVFDARTALVFETEPLAPGGHHELSPPTEELLRVVRGRVLSPRGKPLDGVAVSVQAHSYVLQIPGHPKPMTTFGAGPQTTTDPQGYFELTQVPPRHAWLRVGQSGRMTLRTAIDPDQPVGMEIVLPRIATLAVELIAPRGGESMDLLDGAGRSIPMQRTQALTRQAIPSWEFDGPRSPVLEVPETASTLVLRVPGEAPLHVPLALEAGGALRLRL